MRSNRDYGQDSSSWLAVLLIVAAGIWAIPLAWYFKQKKDNQL